MNTQFRYRLSIGLSLICLVGCMHPALAGRRQKTRSQAKEIYTVDGTTVVILPDSTEPQIKAKRKLTKEERLYKYALIQELERFDLKNPTADIPKAVQKGDLRFLAVYGYAPIIPGVKEIVRNLPGVEEYDPNGGKYVRNKYVSRYGYRLIKGADTCMAVDWQHSQLRDKAFTYAEKYNKLLLVYLKERERFAAP
jgi:hypothetical protein